MSIDKRAAALFARTSTSELVKALRVLDGQASSPERNWSRGQMIEELERRFPQASAAVEAAFDEAEQQIIAGVDVQVDYVAVLVGAIPAEALR